MEAALRAAGVASWYDRRHFPLANDGFEALRKGLAESRHVVYLITRATLENRRGWQLLERVLAAQVQDAFRSAGNELVRYELPLVLLPDDAAARDTLNRSIWQPVMGRAAFCPVDGPAAVDWAAEQIVRFILQEQEHAVFVAEGYLEDPIFRRGVDAADAAVPGVKRRALEIPGWLDPTPAS